MLRRRKQVDDGRSRSHLDFSASVGSIADARHALRSAVDGRMDARLQQDARLMLSELATNAVRHGRTSYRVDVDIDDRRLRVVVTDDGPGFHVTRRAAAGDPGPKLAEGGRGLAIVASLSSRWGVERDGAGARVWFELDRDADGGFT